MEGRLHARFTQTAFIHSVMICEAFINDLHTSIKDTERVSYNLCLQRSCNTKFIAAMQFSYVKAASCLGLLDILIKYININQDVLIEGNVPEEHFVKLCLEL